MAAEHLQSCFYVEKFEEFMEILHVPEDLECQYCINVRLFDYIHFKSHMLKVHFHHSYILEHDGKSGIALLLLVLVDIGNIEIVVLRFITGRLVIRAAVNPYSCQSEHSFDI